MTASGAPLLDAAPSRAALVVVDVQRDFCDPVVRPFPFRPGVAEAVRAAAVRAGELADAARALGVHVVWVRLERRDDNRWAASEWRFRRTPDAWTPCVAGTAGADWFCVAPADGDLIVSKARHSAFLGTPLLARLRTLGVEWVAVCGITTDCCVEATVRDAYQLDLPPVVVCDASAAHDPDRHRASLAIMAEHMAVVVDADALLRHWQAGVAGSAEGILEGFTTGGVG